MRFVVAALGVAIATAAPAAAMELTSPDIKNGATAPKSIVGRDCGGRNIAPALSWSGAPTGTQSFTVMVYDPDAGPTGFHHWIVVDIPPKVTSLPEGGALPAGAIAGVNDYAEARYGGPCPPKGDKPHHYLFQVWAEDQPVYPYPQSTSGIYVRPWMHMHGIGKAEIAVTYGR